MFVVVRSLYTPYTLNTLHFWRRGNVCERHKTARIMPTFGKLDEYNETKTWRHYSERVNHFLEANEIIDPGKRSSNFSG